MVSRCSRQFSARLVAPLERWDVSRRLPSPHVNELVFLGCYCLLLAYLIYNATFLPRFLSVLLALTGLGWLTMILRRSASDYSFGTS